MAHPGRRKLSRRQRKRAGLGRDRSRPRSDEAIARALRQAPETNRATGDTPISLPEAPAATSAESQALGDLSVRPGGYAPHRHTGGRNVCAVGGSCGGVGRWLPMDQLLDVGPDGWHGFGNPQPYSPKLRPQGARLRR